MLRRAVGLYGAGGQGKRDTLKGMAGGREDKSQSDGVGVQLGGSRGGN